MSTVFIYALRCPTSGGVRYIGKAENPAQRYAKHLASQEKCHRGNWVRSVLATGGRPVMEILDEVLEAEWPSWEVAYIQFFREEGCDLVNATCGGEGVEMTEEIRAKIGAANLGKKQSLETIAKRSAANLGKKHSSEARAKISAAHLGKKLSAEHRAKLSAAHLGKKLSAEHRAKLSAVQVGEKNHNFGKKHSLEARAKMSAANLGKKLSSEHCAKMSAAISGEKHYFFGKKRSLETRAKLSAVLLGKKRGPYRKKHSAEERRRVSASFT